MVRNANADRYRADVDVAIIDVPAFLLAVVRSAAGEVGHVPSERQICRAKSR